MAGLKKYPYKKEFELERQRVFAARLRFFCGLAIVVYISASMLCYLLDPAAFRKTELFTWVFLAAAAGVSLFINRRVKTLRGAKLNAGLFSLAIVTVLTALFFIYPGYTAQCSEVLALSAFLISFTIPWQAFETLLIGAAHITGYTVIFAHAALNAPDIARMRSIIFEETGYVDGLVFLVIAIGICIVIRRRDDKSDRDRFLLFRELEAKNSEMARELAIAKDVHKTLIPKSTSTENAAIAVSYVPLSTVGGDYATFHVTKEGNLFFLIGDVTGHGVPAALLVNRIYGEVETLIGRNMAPGALMRELEKFVGEHFQHTEMYFSVCSGLIDFGAQTLFYSNYGHPPQILHQRRDNRISLLESQTYLLGIDAGGAGQSIFEGSLRFDRKDRIVLFTDGLIEAKGRLGDLYGMDRLEAFVKSRGQEQPAVFNSRLLAEIDAFKGGPLADDLFLVTIDIK